MNGLCKHYYVLATSAVILLWIVLYFSQFAISSSISLVLCIFLVVTLGIFHGSNDLFALRYLLNDSKIPYPLKVAVYILCALLFIMLYIIDERIMLIAFIAISAYHFGEERSTGNKGVKRN